MHPFSKINFYYLIFLVVKTPHSGLGHHIKRPAPHTRNPAFFIGHWSLVIGHWSLVSSHWSEYQAFLLGIGHCQHCQHLKCAPRNFIPDEVKLVRAGPLRFDESKAVAHIDQEFVTPKPLNSQTPKPLNSQTPKPLNSQTLKSTHPLTHSLTHSFPNAFPTAAPYRAGA
jgi:hypothetical protein